MEFDFGTDDPPSVHFDWGIPVDSDIIPTEFSTNPLDTSSNSSSQPQPEDPFANQGQPMATVPISDWEFPSEAISVTFDVGGAPPVDFDFHTPPRQTEPFFDTSAEYSSLEEDTKQTSETTQPEQQSPVETISSFEPIVSFGIQSGSLAEDFFPIPVTEEEPASALPETNLQEEFAILNSQEELSDSHFSSSEITEDTTEEISVSSEIHQFTFEAVRNDQEVAIIGELQTLAEEFSFSNESVDSQPSQEVESNQEVPSFTESTPETNQEDTLFPSTVTPAESPELQKKAEPEIVEPEVKVVPSDLFADFSGPSIFDSFGNSSTDSFQPPAPNSFTNSFDAFQAPSVASDAFGFFDSLGVAPENEFPSFATDSGFIPATDAMGSSLYDPPSSSWEPVGGPVSSPWDPPGISHSGPHESSSIEFSSPSDFGFGVAPTLPSVPAFSDSFLDPVGVSAQPVGFSDWGFSDPIDTPSEYSGSSAELDPTPIELPRAAHALIAMGPGGKMVLFSRTDSYSPQKPNVTSINNAVKSSEFVQQVQAVRKCSMIIPLRVTTFG
jgi:hypothetical protein